MAPEQVRGERVDGRCDVYGLGILLYEMLTGLPPFAGAALEIVAHHLVTAPPPLGPRAPAAPAWLVALVATMLAKAPADRPTMAEVAAMLAGMRSSGDRTAVRVIELTADPAEDDLDRETDRFIAELAIAASRPRLAIGSSS
jgi:serine/threonine protein kinase